MFRYPSEITDNNIFIIPLEGKKLCPSFLHNSFYGMLHFPSVARSFGTHVSRRAGVLSLSPRCLLPTRATCSCGRDERGGTVERFPSRKSRPGGAEPPGSGRDRRCGRQSLDRAGLVKKSTDFQGAGGVHAAHVNARGVVLQGCADAKLRERRASRNKNCYRSELTLKAALSPEARTVGGEPRRA